MSLPAAAAKLAGADGVLVERLLELVLFPGLLGDRPQLAWERVDAVVVTPDGAKTAWLGCLLMLEWTPKQGSIGERANLRCSGLRAG